MKKSSKRTKQRRSYYVSKKKGKMEGRSNPLHGKERGRKGGDKIKAKKGDSWEVNRERTALKKGLGVEKRGRAVTEKRR